MKGLHTAESHSANFAAELGQKTNKKLKPKYLHIRMTFIIEVLFLKSGSAMNQLQYQILIARWKNFYTQTLNV